MKRLTLAMAAVALTLGISTTASAASSTAALNLTVAIQPACTVSATSMNFGNYPGNSVNTDGAVTVNCVAGTPYTIGLDRGSYRTSTRNLGDDIRPGRIAYGLYVDVARLNEWGDGVTNPGVQRSFAGNGQPQTVPVYGKLLPGATLPEAGVYTDFVTVIVNY